jgi:alkanesulfonate monooxygenase SsuD/methylene tetrahydromethanopterin reductase-like flavin-dependent oxidoreductase (luciferase family)
MAAGLRAVTEAARDNGRELAAAAEELAREVTLLGTYDQAGHAVAAWFAAGADRVQLVLPPGRPEDELAEIVAVAARVAATSGSDPSRPTKAKLV